MKTCAGMLWNTLENLGRVVFHEMSRPSSQTTSNFWNPPNEFWYRRCYLHSLTSKLSSWNESILEVSHRKLSYGSGTPVKEGLCILSTSEWEHTHTKVNWTHSQPSACLPLTPVLLSTNQAGWGRNSICTSAFDTLIYFSCSPTSQVFLYYGFRSNTKLWVWQHHLYTRSGSDSSFMGQRCTSNYLLTLIAALERQHLHYVLF